MFYSNARSIFPEINKLFALSSVYYPDVICIVESWFSSEIPDLDVQFKSMYLFVMIVTALIGGCIIVMLNLI